MLLFLRKILFYILLIAYLIATPYAILYGLGYTMNAKEGEWVKTGLLSIVTEPRGATVFMENKRYSRKSPATIGGLLPGEYNVRLSKKGFESWKKTVRIAAEKATRLDPVILLPKTPETEIISQGPFYEILPSGDYKLFALKNKTLASLLKIDMLFNKETPIGNKIPDANSIQISKIFSRERSNIILFKIEKNGKQGYLLYDLKHEKIIADLSSKISEADLVQWQPKNPDFIYSLSKGQGQGVNLEHPEQPAVAVPDVCGIGLERGHLYYLKNDFSFWESGLKGDEAEEVSVQQPWDKSLFQNSGARYFRVELLKREFFRKDWFVFLGDNGALLSGRPPYKLIDKGVLGILHSTRGDSDKFLYWTSEQIGVFDFAFNEEEENSWPPRSVLYSEGSGIKKAVWAFDNSHILFHEGNKIRLLEAGNGTPYEVHDIADTAPSTSMFYSESQKAVYYLNRDRKLIKRKITE